MASLQEEKESELAEARDELTDTQDEVLALQQAAEEAAGERENDIASLQEELCRARAQLQRLNATAQEYELEITTLRAEIAMKSRRREEERREGDVDVLREERRTLKEECRTLEQDNRQLSERLQQLQLQSTGSPGDVHTALREEGEEEEEEGGGADGYISVTPSRTNCRLVDASIQKNISFEGKPVTPTGWTGGLGEISSLREQLKQAEERAAQVQRACEGLKAELAELQVLYDSSQSERAELERELQLCKEELQQLMERKSKSSTPPSESPILSIPFIGMIVIVALIWCWCAELSS
ncbi:hypothetical protein AAFF_G00173950 [Aldrovandia affinis]|uniref:Coiled-coil domain-containing protein 136-like n=1 Tax=Aldrovandia affinis TaxID=143900 RepID=A0AAD7WX07_9TELE|nr:hypothetical protein AAFF_G00173950 [Aldrovandia affinis]